MTMTIEEAAQRLKTAERVLVIGCSGSGKSTLALRLAGRLGLPYVSMDREIFWLPGWQPRPRAEALARLEEIVAGERWIIDGTSPGTLALRLPRTHLVLWLDVALRCDFPLAALSRAFAAGNGRRLPGEDRPRIPGLHLEFRGDGKPRDRGESCGIWTGRAGLRVEIAA